ncbi:LLM class flavin-dependent oxidoreductase [Agrobacterium vitis]|nr:LLM class flavin-dependent oxidoreductase [Agrobacterium vitis]
MTLSDPQTSHIPASEAEYFWYIGPPDGKEPWNPGARRPFTSDYARQLANSLDTLGFDGALFGTGAHDTWVLSSQLIAETKRLKFLLATYPMLISPILAAKMAQSFEYAAPGRVALNIVNANSAVARSLGSGLDHASRYALTHEWLPLFRTAVSGQPFLFDGEHLHAEGKAERLVGSEVALPELWMAGSSPEAVDIAARHIDRYLSWGEPPEVLGQKHIAVAQAAVAHGRKPSFGVRLNVILRDTDEEAWDFAERIYRSVPLEKREAAMAGKAATDSVGIGRMAKLYEGRDINDPRSLEFEPGLWLGLGLMQFSGNSTTVIGSPATVKGVFARYRRHGISTFILSGYPLLEEAYRFGETVLPDLRHDTLEQ